MRVVAARGMLVGLLALAGCAGLGGADAPKRPPLDVADKVTKVDRSLVVGTWRCRELNPYPEVPRQTMLYTYSADGTFLAEGRSEARPPFGEMQVKATGRWTVDGDRIVTSDVRSEAASQDAFTNMMAGIGASIVNGLGMAQGDGRSDVLALTRSELVTRPADVEDPPTFSCTR